MKYFLLFCIFVAVLVGVLISPIPYKEPILIVVMLLTFGVQMLWRYSVTTRTFAGELHIARQKKSISLSSVLLAAVWSVFSFLGKRTQDLYVAGFVWAWVIADVITYFIYRQKKPIGLVVDGKNLIINDLWLIERDLNELTELNLDKTNTHLELIFASKPKVKINTKEYEAMDIYLFVEYITRHSSQKIELSESLNKALKSYKSAT